MTYDIASNYAGRTKQNLPLQISHISFWNAFVPYCSQIPRSKNNRPTLAEDIKILHTYPTSGIQPLNRLSIWRRVDSTRQSHYPQYCGRPTTWKRNWKGWGKKNWGKFHSCHEQQTNEPKLSDSLFHNLHFYCPYLYPTLPYLVFVLGLLLPPTDHRCTDMQNRT